MRLKNLYVLILLFSFLTACDPDRKKKIDSNTSKFETLDSSELFFKNMRQTYYDIEQKKDAGIEIYKLQDRLSDSTQALIDLSIVFNWRVDKAFIYIEPNSFFTDSSNFTIIWQDTVTQTQGEFQFFKGDRESHFHFSSEIYNSILDEKKLFYKKENKLIPILDTEVERDVFRVTMFDFLRLVNYFSSK